MKKVCFVNSFGQIETMHGNCLKEPAVQIIAEDDLFVRFGECDMLMDRSEREMKAMFSRKEKFFAIGRPFAVPARTVVCMSGMKPEMACYVIRRMAEYSASGFVKKFYKQMHESSNGYSLTDWLEQEMKRVPIDVTDAGKE